MQVAPEDFWFHSEVLGLKKASGTIRWLELGWTDAGV